jgi:hypothetical protein
MKIGCNERWDDQRGKLLQAVAPSHLIELRGLGTRVVQKRVSHEPDSRQRRWCRAILHAVLDRDVTREGTEVKGKKEAARQPAFV